MRPLPAAPPIRSSRPPDRGLQPALRLVPSQPRPQPSCSPLALWHLLSLDAPTVAALWTIFIARCAGVSLSWTQPAGMFVAVWMIYAADRLLDARLLDAHPLDARPLDSHPLPDSSVSPGRAAPHRDSVVQHELEARHRFHHRYRGRFQTAIILASVALVILLQHIANSALHLYALLAALLAGYLLLIHARALPTPALRRLPKELAVGIFFPAAVFIPTVARAPWLRPALLPAAALFAAVCTLNCLFLYAWEHPGPRLQAHWTTRWATAHLTYLATLLCAAATVLTLPGLVRSLRHATLRSALPFLLTSAVDPRLYVFRDPATACALSAALLLLLHLFRRRLSAVHLRASADLVLLTPLLLLPLLRSAAR